MSAEESEYRAMIARVSGEHADDDGIGVTRFHRDAIDVVGYQHIGNRLDDIAPQPSNTINLGDARQVGKLFREIMNRLDDDEQPWERDRIDSIMLRLDGDAPSIGQALPIRNARAYLARALMTRQKFLLL